LPKSPIQATTLEPMSLKSLKLICEKHYRRKHTTLAFAKSLSYGAEGIGLAISDGEKDLKKNGSNCTMSFGAVEIYF